MSADLTESPRILVGVASRSGHAVRRQAIRRTWASGPPRGIEIQFFTGSAATPATPQSAIAEPDVVHLPAADDQGALPERVLGFFRHAVENRPFDWLFRCNDNTYLAVDRLPELIDAGADLIGNEFIGLLGEPSGGAGYLISHRLIERLASEPEVPVTGAEAGMFSLATGRRRARMLATKRLRWDCQEVPAWGNDLVTAHWCSPARMFAIHEFMTEPAPVHFAVTHRHWRDRIALHPDGTFHRVAGSCRGNWTLDDHGDLSLAWEKWPVERVERTGNGYRSEVMELTRVRRQPAAVGGGKRPEVPRRRIDLRTLPVVVTSGWSFGGRRKTLAGKLRDLGFRKPRFFTAELGSGGPPYPSITLNHLVAIASQPPPFILLEDDAWPTDWFVPEVDAPADSDALWLGITSYGMAGHRPTPGAALLTGPRDCPRVANMLGTHAVLFISPAFTDAVRDRLWSLLRHTPEVPHDRALAEMQGNWVVHATNPPLLFQNDGHLPCVTNSEVEVSNA